LEVYKGLKEVEIADLSKTKEDEEEYEKDNNRIFEILSE